MEIEWLGCPKCHSGKCEQHNTRTAVPKQEKQKSSFNKISSKIISIVKR